MPIFPVGNERTPPPWGRVGSPKGRPKHYDDDILRGVKDHAKGSSKEWFHPADGPAEIKKGRDGPASKGHGAEA